MEYDYDEDGNLVVAGTTTPVEQLQEDTSSPSSSQLVQDVQQGDD